jgi:hypothetical protein
VNQIGTTLNGFGWMTMLLPQIDQANIYNQFSTANPNVLTGLSGLTAAVPSNGTIQSVIAAFRCPTDVGLGLTFVGAINGVAPSPNAVVGFGRSNYVGVAGIDPNIGGSIAYGNVSPFAPALPISTATPPTQWGGIGCYANTGTLQGGNVAYTYSVDVAQFGGVFGLQSKKGIRDMTDGTSNTILVGERYTPQATGTTPTLAQGITAIGDATWVGATDLGSSSFSAAGSVSNPGQAGQAAVLGEGSNGINYGVSGTSPRPNSTGFGSLHTGGAHFAMGDGTVRFISTNINLATLQFLSRTADGNVVGPF